MSNALSTLEAKAHAAQITLAHKMGSAAAAVVEMRGFSEANSFCWEHSVSETAKMLASIANDIQATAATLQAYRSAIELISKP